MSMLILVGSLLLAGSAVHGSGPEEEAAAAEAAKRTQEEKGGPNQFICRKMPPPAGTRLRARQICKTKAEWEMMDKDMRDGLREAQRKPFQAG